MKQILVVGAGFAGAVLARELADSGECAVTVIDSRDHIAGNAYDPVDPQSGIRIHRYGPHIFHTDDKRIYDYLSRFTEWLPYEHRVEALVEEVGYVPLPINITTLNRLYGQRLESEVQMREFLGHLASHHPAPRNAREMAENTYGPELTELFFGRYTRKMWGMDLDELPASVLARVPVRYNDERAYFHDRYQAMPKHGYVTLFENLLDHPKIALRLNTPFAPAMEPHYAHIFNSMPIDVYYDNRFGALPYRSIRFEHRRVAQHRQPVPTVNLTDTSPVTRFTDWRLYPGCGQGNGGAVVTYEYPCSYEENGYERYYPVKTVDGEPQQRYAQYKALAATHPKMTFIGRCGQYRYYDMHQVVANSRVIATQFLDGTHQPYSSTTQ